jgi:outer membrane protein OmpA-like peptidoglycan-associated protein
MLAENSRNRIIFFAMILLMCSFSYCFSEESAAKPWFIPEENASSPISQASGLEVGAVSIQGSLLLEGYVHKLGDGWETTKAGYKGMNFYHTFVATSTTSPSTNSVFGETLFLDLAIRPYKNFYGYFGFEATGDYADRYWMPINFEHRMSVDNNHFDWFKSDIMYKTDLLTLRYFRNIGHYNWSYDGDLFNLFPEQNEPNRYLRVSGRPAPEGYQFILNTQTNKLNILYGKEILWDFNDSLFLNYNFYLWDRNFYFIYRDEEIPYGDPDERLRSAELSTSFDISSTQLQVAGLFQPFRLNRSYSYVDDVGEGNGDLGSRYIEKFGVTGSQDALGFTSKLSFKPYEFINEAYLQYTYRGLVAGNKQEASATVFSWLSRYLLGSIEYTYRKPLIGPMPLIKADSGPAIFEPRGPESPFWVGWNKSDSGWDNREASILSFIFTFDTTPNSWFFKYQPNILEDYNLNPEEDSPVSFAAKYSLVKYFTTTDRLYYWDQNGNIVWEPPLLGGAWATDSYLGSFTLISKIIAAEWRYVLDTGFGESLAENSFAYNDNTNQFEPITPYFSCGIKADRRPYSIAVRYGQNVWGPEQWHREFGFAFDQLYQLSVARDFGDYVNAGVEYVGARELTHQYTAIELGDYDELRFFVKIAFGPIMPYFGKKPLSDMTIGEAVEHDTIPPQVQVKVSTPTFTPNDDKVNDTLDIEMLATDYSGIRDWKLEIANSQGQVVKTFAGQNEPPFKATWDGKDDIYEKTVPDGYYSIKLTATDRASNSAVSEPVKVYANITPPIKEVLKVISKEVAVQETERGLRVTLTSQVLFGSGQTALTKGALKILGELVSVLNEYPKNMAAVEGHTDNIGSRPYNQKLSEKRAWNVAKYLISEGIPAERLRVTGYGKDNPVASNDTPDGRQNNRRVEVIILK